MSTKEHQRLQEIPDGDDVTSWRRWGPYLSDRAWATVREDYSPDGNAWGYLPHELAPQEGNHGEDVKEYYFHLDNTPTHSYMKFLYKYPQQKFPYGKLIDENRGRSGQGLEYELIDTGI